MRKRSTYVARIVILAAVASSFCFTQQKAPTAKPAEASSGKEYASSSLRPGIWHIEDTVHETYRNSMYLVEGTEKAALIDTGMGTGDLAGYIRTYKIAVKLQASF